VPHHFSKTEHIALSFNDPNAIANASLNNWTFVPQIPYTKLWPEQGIEFDAVGAVRFDTRKTATDYQRRSTKSKTRESRRRRRSSAACEKRGPRSSNHLWMTSREYIAVLKFNASLLEEAGRKPGGIWHAHSLNRR
jgi:hypothetical protein